MTSATPRMTGDLNVSGDVHVERDFIVGNKIIYNYRPIQHAPAREAFRGLLDDRRHLFGGRNAAIETIYAFLGRTDASRLMITAPAGFGKTALLANLVGPNPDAFAYHFFAPSEFRESVQEDWFLHNLVEQMADWYGITDPVPERKDALAPLFRKYLAEAPATRVLVIDGLDEVTSWNLEPYVGRPLPRGLKLILSVRDVGQDWLAEYGLSWADTQHLPLGGLAHDELASVLHADGKVAQAIASDPDLLERAVKAAAYPDNPALGADPFYVRVLAQDAADATLTANRQVLLPKPPNARAKQLSLAAYVDSRPRGLASYLDRWYADVEKAVGEAATLHLLATLSVALGPIERDDLTRLYPALAEGWPSLLDTALERAERLVLERDGETLAFVHPRLRQHVQSRMERRAPTVLKDHADALVTYCGAWRDHHSAYALRYYVQHLQDRAASSVGSTRPELLEHIAALLVDPAFLELRKQLGDLAGLQTDFERTLAAVCREPSVGLDSVVNVALTWLAFRRGQLQPDHIFELAEAGSLDESVRQLSLFVPPLDGNWYRAVRLLLAWLGSDVDAPAARAVCARVEEDLRRLPPGEHKARLERLRNWVRAALDGGPPPPPGVVGRTDAWIVRALVDRLSGSGLQQSMLGELGRPELVGPGEGRYLAATDGPYLVSLALAQPTEGEPLLNEYLAVHRAYRYVQYRNGSLWALLKAVLEHPGQDWVRARVLDLCRIAMAESGVEFQAGLGLTALALCAFAGDPAASQQFDAAIANALDEASRLWAERGHADTWGTHKRRLAVLAEACSRSPAWQSRVEELLQRALGTPYGFAGYQAPACLAMAEAILIATPADAAGFERALSDALTAAHNVQDATLCARTTARVMALKHGRWAQPPAGGNLAQAIERLAADPTAGEFASEHRIGERYTRRDPNTTVLLADEVREANTLEALARIYDLPVAEFRRVNAGMGWTVDRPIGDGELVRVPDPGFVPLLAARLAAHALVETSFSPEQRRSLIGLLVPVAFSNPTALDTVLSRLSLAHADAADTALLQVVEELAEARTPPLESDMVSAQLPS